jgi:DHA1 family multidrug resistance protein-like MFS transporter
MLLTERIVLLLSVYMAFIYGLLYLFLTAYPLVFQGVHGMNLGVGGLPFFGMITGQLLAGMVIFIRQPGYQKKLAANNDVPIPEWRLPEVIVGGVCFSIGIFWFGWTGYRQDIHWIVPTLGGILIGFGLLSIFLQALNYLVDAYLMVRPNLSSPFPPLPPGPILTSSLVRRLRNRSKHLPTLPLRRRISALRTPDV